MRKIITTMAAAALVMGFTAAVQAQGNGGDTGGNIKSQGGTGNGVNDKGMTQGSGMGSGMNHMSHHKMKRHHHHSKM